MPLRASAIVSALLLTLVGSLGCNSLTGADGLAIDDNWGSSKKKHHGSSTSSSSSGGSGAGGSEEVPPAPEPKWADARGVSVQEIALYQGVKHPLMAGGSPASATVPVIAGRSALVRVFVATDGSYDGSPVTARLYLDAQPDPLEVSTSVGGGSSEGDLGSTINFDVPGELVTTSFAYRVELVQPALGNDPVNDAAHYPAAGLEGVEAKSAGSKLKVQLVPISYGGDGSNRLPDTSDGQLQSYANLLYSIYPIPSIELSVHAPVQYDGSASADGNGWDSLLNALADFRAQENPGDDVYYFGIFAPGSSFGAYCSGGCVAGLGFVGGPTDSYTRAAIGLGFTGPEAAETAVHEIGHNHGRDHSPCGGAAGADPSFPYAQAGIGTWGYDLLTHQLKSPSQYKDLMGYCWPIWISDYNFNALFSRMRFVNGARIDVPADQQDLTYERAHLKADGSLEWLAPLRLHAPPQGEPVTVTLTDEAHAEKVTGQLYRYDHLEGGMLWWPERAFTGSAVHAEIAGKLVTLTR